MSRTPLYPGSAASLASPGTAPHGRIRSAGSTASTVATSSVTHSLARFTYRVVRIRIVRTDQYPHPHGPLRSLARPHRLHASRLRDLPARRHGQAGCSSAPLRTPPLTCVCPGADGSWTRLVRFVIAGKTGRAALLLTGESSVIASDRYSPGRAIVRRRWEHYVAAYSRALPQALGIAEVGGSAQHAAALRRPHLLRSGRPLVTTADPLAVRHRRITAPPLQKLRDLDKRPLLSSGCLCSSSQPRAI